MPFEKPPRSKCRIDSDLGSPLETWQQFAPMGCTPAQVGIVCDFMVGQHGLHFSMPIVRSQQPVAAADGRANSTITRPSR